MVVPGCSRAECWHHPVLSSLCAMGRALLSGVKLPCPVSTIHALFVCRVLRLSKQCTFRRQNCQGSKHCVPVVPGFKPPLWLYQSSKHCVLVVLGLAHLNILCRNSSQKCPCHIWYHHSVRGLRHNAAPVIANICATLRWVLWHIVLSARLSVPETLAAGETRRTLNPDGASDRTPDQLIPSSQTRSVQPVCAIAQESSCGNQFECQTVIRKLVNSDFGREKFACFCEFETFENH